MPTSLLAGRPQAALKLRYCDWAMPARQSTGGRSMLNDPSAPGVQGLTA
ncbi:hypothetical protein ABZX65_29015 [Streptomyces sp. NPDC003300]